MGLIYKGIHQAVALKLRDEMNLRVLVETGTYKGDTVKWAIDKFDKVISMDISHEFVDRVAKDIKANNVLLIHGDSRERLAPVCRGRHNEPTLFWLDAHWTGEKEYKDPLGMCPLLEEVTAINDNFFGAHAIMIDDYSLWVKPLLDKLKVLLCDKGRSERDIAVTDDIVIACRHMPRAFLGYLI